jgi:hypothetical protein
MKATKDEGFYENPQKENLVMKTKKDDILLLKPRRRNKFKEILV